MELHGIRVRREAVAEFCRANGIRRLALFGSILEDRFREDSDVDVLVEFEPGRTPGYFGLVRLEREISPLFGGRKVDLRTPEELSRYFRDAVRESALVQYERE